MERSQKRVLIVLAVVAVLFIVVIVGGAGRGGKSGFSAANPPGWIEGIEKLFVGKSSFGSRDTQGCRTGDDYVLRPGERCQVTVQAADVPVREAQLVLEEGLEVRLELVQPGSVPQRDTLRSGKPVALKVFKDGAKLALRCVRAAEGERCRLRLHKPPK